MAASINGNACGGCAQAWGIQKKTAQQAETTEEKRGIELVVGDDVAPNSSACLNESKTLRVCREPIVAVKKPEEGSKGARQQTEAKRRHKHHAKVRVKEEAKHRGAAKTQLGTHHRVLRGPVLVDVSACCFVSMPEYDSTKTQLKTHMTMAGSTLER